MKKNIVVFLFIISVSLNAQSNFSKFFDLSGPKKIWVIFHPFKAKKSLLISNETNRISDSIAKTNLLDGDVAGGQVDAFRHAYWMARLKQEFGKSAAKSLGKAHEKENYITFKNNKLEDGVVPDKISSEMDLHNNDEGLKLIEKGSTISRNSLIFKIVNAINDGKMKIIRKDDNGNFLTCEGRIIVPKVLNNKWENNKCLIDSNK